MSDNDKMILSADDAAKAYKQTAKVVDKFLDPQSPKANLVGMGYGIKWTNGQPTGEPAVLALVTQKLDEDDLVPDDLIPKKMGTLSTDVLAIGEPVAEQEQPIEVGIQELARRTRPASGGYSVAHRDVTAGTIGTCVFDRLGTPGNPSGMPEHYYILSNNHVLANSNRARFGDPVFQPGPLDGGVDPSDRIGTVSRYIRIDFEPRIPRLFHKNLVDAALAEGQFHDLKREIHWIGHLRGWRKRSQNEVGNPVRKTGRTTNYTSGRITVVNATVDVGYPGVGVARFRDQIITTPISAPGDSGSMVVDDDNYAVGLLFAGSPDATILNQIQHVRKLLRIDFL